MKRWRGLAGRRRREVVDEADAKEVAAAERGG